MDYEAFKLLHSELICKVQGIEYDLKLIYAAIKEGDFEKNFSEVQNLSLGDAALSLKRIDYADNIPDLSEQEYDFIDKIRVLRNYWCHQCYVDFMYINNEAMREEKFNEIFAKLKSDETQIAELFDKLEKFRITELKTYGRM